MAEIANEIPAVRAWHELLKPAGRLVRIAALPPSSETTRQIVSEHGGDYLMTDKNNQPTVPAAVPGVGPDPGSLSCPVEGSRDGALDQP